MAGEGELIGSAHVDIDINASPAEAALARLEAKAERTFTELGRKKAEASLDVKTTDFDRKIDKAKGELADLESKKARVSVSLKGDIEKEIAEVKAEIKQLDREKATIKVDSRQLKAANKEQRLLSEARALDEKRALDQAKAERVLNTERSRSVAAIQREGKVQAKAAAENAKFDAERIDSTIKNRAALAKLAAEYEKLAGRQKALKKSSAGIFSSKSIGTAENEARKLERVGSEMDLVKHKIESLGGSVEGLDPSVRKNSSLLDRWISKLGDTSIRIGPVTTSLKGLGIGLGLLGPLVFDLGGGLVSLAGFLGAGIAGAAAVGGGALAGFGASALGVGLIIGPMIGEFKEATKASTALHQAELKYGRGSEQVKTAQERLNNELKGVSPIAREGFKAYAGLSSKWKELTKAARPAVFNAFGQSLKTAQALLPGFARESTKTTEVAGKAWDGWMKSLRSSEAKGLLNNVMGDFRQSIPGLSSGLASLAAMIGRIGAAGAHFLPGLSHGFADWANNLEKSVGGGQKLTGEVGGMVDKMKDFGHLTQDTGSFLVHFFGASASAGDGLSNSLDKVMQKWNRWSQTAEGKASLKNFFSESKSATEDFMSSLGHFTELLFAFSRATAPLANGLLKVVSFIGDIVSAADQIVGVKQIFQGLGIVLGGLFVASKVMAYTDALTGVLARLGLMGAAGTAAAAGEAEVAAGAIAATGALEAEALAASEADAALGAGAANATRAALGLTGAADGAGVLAAALAPEVLIPAGVIAALALFIGNTGKAETAWTRAAAKFRETGRELSNSVRGFTKDGESYGKGMTEQAAVTDKVSAARHHLIKLQKESAPEAKLTQAVLALNQAEHEQIAVGVQNAQGRVKSVAAAKQTLAAAKANIAAAKEKIKANKEEQRQAIGPEGEHVTHSDLNPAILRKEAEAQKSLSQAQREAGSAARELTVANIPLERQTRGLAPITEKTAEALKKLSTTIGTAATKKIGNFVDPGDVAKVANLSNHLTKLGQGSTVKKIDVKSNGADQTISKLQQVSRQSNKITGKVAQLNVKTNDAGAQQKLSRLSQLSQKVAGASPTLHILANADNAEQAAQHIEQHLHRLAEAKYQARITAIDQATAPGTKARATLVAAAQGKYQARITAIDNASAPAKKAKQAADSVKGSYAAHVSAPGAAQAAQQIDSVTSALAALPTSKTVTVHYSSTGSTSPHHFAGGPAVYASPFAVGGPSDAMLERAADKAVFVPTGPSRKVVKPTMLTGEEPGHPEYVIATNPAYRPSNEKYLESAAEDLGKEVVPAYKKGKGKAANPGPPPYKPQSKKHHNVTNHKFAPGSVEELNTAEGSLSNLEGKFNAELTREEQEISHHKRTAWDFGTLKGFLTQEAAIQSKIIHNIIPTIVGASAGARDKAEHELHGPLSKGKVAAARKEANKVDREYSNLKAPTSPSKAPGESEASYKAKQKEYSQQKHGYEKHKKTLKRNAKEAKAYADRLEKERQDALALREEARAELKEVRHEVVVEHETALNEIETNQENVGDIEANPELAPYYESPGASGSEKPTPGEETATLSDARQTLYEQFSSNITAGMTPQVAHAATFATGGGAFASSGGAPNYAPAGTNGSSMGSSTGAFGSDTMPAAPVTNNVTNNFAAPPPDPHTWTKQQQFELGALG